MTKAPKQIEEEPLPPPIEEVDVLGQEEYTKKKLKSRKGRKSTILASRAKPNKKTVLG